jgi:ABC-type proline/glycine betaine transport system permease subunit/glycine betaine/choline ABC-type transport system substrate-binding protein
MSPGFYEQLQLLPGFLAGHLLLTITALSTGIVLSLPLGVVAARSAKMSRIVLGTAGMIQTIPSIALLALMVALLAGTIGFLPAFIALSLYSILPILRNTVTGLAGIDPSVVEAARAVGMTERQRLFKVELPLAFPVIIAGIRTSAVWVVGTATLSTPVGARSLGNYIFAGLQTRNVTAVLFGCFFAAALAITLDQLLGLIERSAKRRDARGGTIAVVALLAIFAAGLSPVVLNNLETSVERGTQAVAAGSSLPLPPTETASLAGQVITIGSKGFTEQYILSELLATYLRERGARVELTQGMGTTILFDALQNSSVDIYFEYTGTIWSAIMKRDSFPARRPMHIEIEYLLYEQHGILSLGGLGFENAYGLAMRRSQANALGIHSIADLAAHAPSLVFAGDPEFFSRAEWRNVSDTYDLVAGSQRTMDSTFMYQALRDGEVDVISAYTTDGRIDVYDLLVLDDPLQGLPPYDTLILLSPGAQKIPGLSRTLSPLVNSISQAAIRNANRQVDLNGLSPAAAARLLRQDMRL